MEAVPRRPAGAHHGLAAPQIPRLFVKIIISEAPVFKYFYCSVCTAWKRISTSTGYMRIHYDNVSHAEERFLEKKQMTTQMATRMTKATTLFLLTNGLPSNLIDDQYFQVLHTLGHRKKAERLILTACSYCVEHH